jgi:hypothetical protein
MGWKIARMVVAKSIYNLARIWRCFNANCTNDQMGRIKGIKAKKFEVFAHSGHSR